jgi:hypothetical protein
MTDSKEGGDLLAVGLESTFDTNEVERLVSQLLGTVAHIITMYVHTPI